MPAARGAVSRLPLVLMPTAPTASARLRQSSRISSSSRARANSGAASRAAVPETIRPLVLERLALTVQRLRQRLASRGSSQEIFAAPLQQVLHRLSSRLNPSSRSAPLTTLQAQVGNAIQMIGVDEVLFFISDEKYTRVQTASREAFIRKPIKELVDQLDPDQFWQIHRSTLVHVQAIERVERDFRGRQVVHIKGHPQKLEVSRSYAGLFKGM